MKEKILIVSNYYPPEKGAAANRIEQLASKLKQNGYEVAVVCPLANYPEGKLFPGHSGKFSLFQNIDGIHVKRLWIYPSNSKNVLKRILSIFSFAICLKIYLLFARLPQKVVVQSPPLMLSFVSVLVLSMRRRKIILNVSDLWPSAAIELGAIRSGSMSHKISLFFEKIIYRRASLILGQSEEIRNHIRTIVPKKQTHLYRNFPDHPVSEPLPGNNSATIKLFYAGLLGVAQGVLDCCRNMNFPSNVEFHIFGDGAEKQEIEGYIVEHPEKKIVFHGMLKRDELHERLKSFDVAFVPLKARIYGSVPSKIFEYGALGIPLLYFGGGEGEDIVRENRLGWIAPVGNFGELNSVLVEVSAMEQSRLRQMRRQIFDTASEKFDLDAQMRRLIEGQVF